MIHLICTHIAKTLRWYEKEASTSQSICTCVFLYFHYVKKTLTVWLLKCRLPKKPSISFLLEYWKHQLCHCVPNYKTYLLHVGMIYTVIYNVIYNANYWTELRYQLKSLLFCSVHDKIYTMFVRFKATLKKIPIGLTDIDTGATFLFN